MTAIRYSIRLVKSQDEAARTGLPYWCEVFAVATLEPLYVTGFYASPRDARREANEWCEQNLGQGK